MNILAYVFSERLILSLKYQSESSGTRLTAHSDNFLLFKSEVETFFLEANPSMNIKFLVYFSLISCSGRYVFGLSRLGELRRGARLCSIRTNYIVLLTFENNHFHIDHVEMCCTDCLARECCFKSPLGFWFGCAPSCKKHRLTNALGLELPVFPSLFLIQKTSRCAECPSRV